MKRKTLFLFFRNKNIINKNLQNKMSNLSKSGLRLLNLAGDASQKSTLNYTHGAVITKKGKKVVEGHNHNRSYSNGMTCCSFHAEIHAVKRWMCTFLRGKRIQCLL